MRFKEQWRSLFAESGLFEVLNFTSPRNKRQEANDLVLF